MLRSSPGICPDHLGLDFGHYRCKQDRPLSCALRLRSRDGSNSRVRHGVFPHFRKPYYLLSQKLKAGESLGSPPRADCKASTQCLRQLCLRLSCGWSRCGHRTSEQPVRSLARVSAFLGSSGNAPDGSVQHPLCYSKSSILRCESTPCPTPKRPRLRIPPVSSGSA